MTRRISLALTLHNHQPIGNFGWVIEDAYERAYRPMVEALERHPDVRLGLHYTGPLLDWLRAERRELIEAVRGLVERGQVEVLGGGLYEPVLAALPERDRLAQLSRMAEAVEATFGARPAGAWLAERVWEPDLPTSLVDAGYGWTILDDAHLRAAAVPEEAMWGPYSTDDQGRRLTVFGTEQGLRYRIPFHDVDEVIGYLREHATEAGERLGTMGDDGEKFGAWPTTFEHCWGEGRWVDRFFEALEANGDWLATVRPSDWLASNPPIGRIAVPTGSYAEMGEWALPAAESRAFGAALRHAREARGAEARWLRGASWRNFAVKYREVNDLHKQMLRVSGKVDAMTAGAARDAALDHLHRGQSNDAYWHGLFGGVYLAHLRAATLAHLIAAEDLADGALGSVAASMVRDLDLDGRDDVLLATDGQVLVIDLDEGAGIGSWDLRAARHALASVLRRRPEAYHDTLRAHEARQAVETGSVSGAGTGTPGAGRADSAAEPASIHELVQVKEAGLADRLVYDEYERRSGLIRVLPPGADPESWRAGGHGDVGDFADGAFEVVRLDPDAVLAARDGSAALDGTTTLLRAESELRLGGGRLDPSLEQRVTLQNRGDRTLVARVGVEWAITMLGGGGNLQAWWELAGERSRHDGAGSAEGIDRIAQGNDWLGVALQTTLGAPADAWWAPIETVSNSEAGFERAYQGAALLVSNLIDLPPGRTWTMTVRHEARITAERDLGA